MSCYLQLLKISSAEGMILKTNNGSLTFPIIMQNRNFPYSYNTKHMLGWRY